MSKSERSIRWWPVAAILVLALGALGWIWLGPAELRQQRVVGTFPVVFFTVLALLL